VLFVAGHKKKYTKDELIDTFWPHKNLRGAAHSLHVEVSALRNILHEILRSDFEKQRIVIFDSHQYYLNPKIYVSTDVQRFQRLVNNADAAVRRVKTRAKQLFMEALDLYRGDFCEDIVADWCDEIRAYYMKLALGVLTKLGQICYDEREYEKSLTYLNRALQLDASDESVHVATMRGLEALGDKDGIQRQYKKLVKALNSMGITTPSSEATEIYQKSLH
jgi:two-component SAPR family response regulator